jgi:hypothetical protein
VDVAKIGQEAMRAIETVERIVSLRDHDGYEVTDVLVIVAAAKPIEDELDPNATEVAIFVEGTAKLPYHAEGLLRAAVATVNSGFGLMQRETIVHELVHCHLDKMVNRFREVTRKTLGREAFEIALDSFDQVYELSTDSIASAWARMLPLIDPSADYGEYPEYECNGD